MKAKFRIIPIVCLFCLSLNSCGVMFGGSRYNATIVAKDHPNAEIYVNGEKEGKGKITKLYKRDQPLKVELKEEGCQSKTKNFDNTFRTGNFILSVISWGILGIGVDLGTGASYKPDHRHNSGIEKINDKDYRFTVEYSECSKPQPTE